MFGISAVSKSNESTIIHATCRSPAECQKGKDLRDSAYGASTAATISFGVGAADTALVGFSQGAILSLEATQLERPVPAGQVVLAPFELLQPGRGVGQRDRVPAQLHL